LNPAFDQDILTLSPQGTQRITGEIGYLLTPAS
jgi:hypothetical protein